MYRLLLFFVILAWAGSASAQLAPPPPTKTITFYNDSQTDTLYPFIQAPIQLGNNVHDLWLQAQLGAKPSDYLTRPFLTTKLYRIWINHDNGGVPPGTFVTITVPFYTQLQGWTEANSGQIKDQFVDWWNAMRVYIFDGKDAADAAYNFSQDNPAPPTPISPVLPPYPIKPLPGAVVPTCGTTNISAGCTLDLRAYYVNPPLTIPAQLVEYTFASAVGPPLDSAFGINLNQVNYNISAVDSIYLPAAIGADGNSTADNTYLGSTKSIAAFHALLSDFSMQGSRWPQYIPSYYLPPNTIGAIPSPNWPPNGITAYSGPQVPSANVVFAQSYSYNGANKPLLPPAPPTLTSFAGTPWVVTPTDGQIGDVGQAMITLWNNCTTTNGDTSATCSKIRDVKKFFVDDYQMCFQKKTPDLSSTGALADFLRDVYGWAQFPGWTSSLYDTQPAQYPSAISDFCDLMYNYFSAWAGPVSVFDPYVKLIHEILGSNAYAFSIDDAVSFKSVPGSGVIITVAGDNGLENKTQTPLPTASTYKGFCQSTPKK